MSDKTPAARLRGNRRQAPPRVLLPGLPQHEQALHYWTAPLSAVQQESEDAVAMLADFVEILLGQLDADLFANISPACRHHLRAALSGDRSAVTSLFLDSVGARLPPLASTSTAVEVAKKVSDDDDAVPSRDGPARGSTATGYQQTMSAAAQRMCRIPEADPFFGGRRELVSRIAEAVRQTMADRRCAIAFLSGQPGVGTSEVALAVARNLSKAFDGGTYYLDLYGLTPDALRNPRTIVRILAEALSLDLGGDAMDETEALDRLFTRLADRKVLLVLDNARDADHIAPLARRVASCGLIITSRDRLQDFADPGLSFTVDILERTESVGLLERFLGDREHNGIDLEGIAALCADVPLALRMVGARIATEPHVDLGYLRRALENETTRLDYLKAGARAVRAAIGLSYALLESQARRTLRLITAFPGTTVTARSLGHCADNDVFRQEFVLHQLTDRNLATYAVASNVLDIPEARFTLFELIRIFAGERLTEEEPQADLEEFRSRAIRYLLDRLVEINDQAREAEVSGELDPSAFHAAEALAEELDQLDVATDLATNLWTMYSARREVDGVVAVNAVRVRLLLRRGEPEKAARACLDNVANLQGMEASQHAEDSCREAARIGEAYNLPVLRAKAMFELNVILGRQGRWQEALEYGELVADLFLELGRPKDAMSVSLNNARFAGRLADHRKRLSWAKRAADLAKRADDQQRHSLAMFQMAYAHCALGDPWEELGASLLAERLSEKLEHWWNAAIGARGAAYAALRLNQPDMARASLTRAVGYLAHGEDLAAKYVETLVDLSSLQVTAEEYEAAASTLAQATRKAAESGSNVPPLIKREAETRAAIVNGFLHRHPSTESSALASSQPDATGTEANQDTTDEVLDAALELFKAWQTVWGSETRFHAVNWGFATGS